MYTEIFLISLYAYIQTYLEKEKYTIISNINTILLAGTCNYLLFFDPMFFDIYNYPQSEVSIIYMYPVKFMTSYVLFDLYYSIFPFKIDLFFHAFLMILSVILVRYYELCHFICVAMVMQSSTIFLTYTQKSKICKVLFALSFFAYRIVFYPLYTYTYIRNRHSDIFSYDVNPHKLVCCLVVPMNALNFYWFGKIVKKAIKPLKGQMPVTN